MKARGHCEADDALCNAGPRPSTGQRQTQCWEGAFTKDPSTNKKMYSKTDVTSGDPSVIPNIFWLFKMLFLVRFVTSRLFFRPELENCACSKLHFQKWSIRSTVGSKVGTIKIETNFSKFFLNKPMKNLADDTVLLPLRREQSPQF
jgi:hypothetical protein